MGYWPHKGSFFYFNQGSITLWYDSSADRTDTCANDQDRCYTSALVDPCARDTPLFKSVVPAYKSYIVSTSNSDTNHAIAFEIVFDSIFVVFSAES